jgi:hypothetical protein
MPTKLTNVLDSNGHWACMPGGAWKGGGLARLADCGLVQGATTTALLAAAHILAGSSMHSLSQRFSPPRVVLERCEHCGTASTHKRQRAARDMWRPRPHRSDGVLRLHQAPVE